MWKSLTPSRRGKREIQSLSSFKKERFSRYREKSDKLIASLKIK
jgi:hypothetical protein